MTKSFEIFPWQKNYAIGIPLIDEQHQKLVHLLNTLASSLATQANTAELKNIFNELALYAIYHFKTEENIWNQSLFDDEWERTHTLLHENFVTQVSELQNLEGIKSFEEVVEDALSFLTNWLIFHILDSDKRMSIALLSIQSGVPIEHAKLRANQEMSGAAQAMVETVLSMSDKLTTRTLALIKQTMEHQRLSAKHFFASKDMKIDLKSMGITERERDVMALVVAGYSSKEIAQHLDISHRTVEVHRAHIMQKTGSSNLSELARIHRE